MRTFLVPTYKSKAVEATASSFTLESRPQYSHATLNGCAANIFRACHHFCLESFRTYSWCRFPLTTSLSLITKSPSTQERDTPTSVEPSQFDLRISIWWWLLPMRFLSDSTFLLLCYCTPDRQIRNTASPLLGLFLSFHHIQRHDSIFTYFSSSS